MRYGIDSQSIENEDELWQQGTKQFRMLSLIFQEVAEYK